ncbi:HalOD1 output domain-containing protein [Halobellus salinisoli]|uniref:HalOD1 output domain-containing protein n=1 Tax=Halobellus salinisoli TaxID=3108500 RepID=UPI00300B75BE
MTADLTTTIVRRTSEVAGTDPGELPPLYESIDPDALETVASNSESVVFTYAGCNIVIKGGDVSVEPIE